MLDSVKQGIDDESIVFNVGNRPHYPIFVAFYGANKDNCAALYNNFAGVWQSQICERLLLYKYGFENDNLVFSDAFTDEQVENQHVYNSIADVAKTNDIFADLSTWCLYNVIDTSHIGFEEFERSFNSLRALKYIIDETVRSMVIIILNDTRDVSRKAINYQIREFLINRKDYDGVIVLSNRSRNGAVYDLPTLYRIISGVILLSANDAVSSVDDKFYRERNYKLYSKIPHSVAYTSLTKPTKDILLCMTDRFVTLVNQKRDSSREDTKFREFTNSDLENAVGIKNHKLAFFEEYIQNLRNQITKDKRLRGIAQYLPLRSETVITDEQLIKNSYSSLKSILFPNAIMMLADDFCRQEIKSNAFKQVFSNYEAYINKNFNLLNVKSITPDRVVATFSAIQNVVYVNEDDPIQVYINNLLVSVMMNNYILPLCIELIETVLDSNNYQQTKKLVDLFTKEISNQIPTKGFGDIPKVYGDYMSDYLGSIDGEKLIMDFLRIGNTYDDLIEVLKEALISANKNCNDRVNMPFITLWANTLKKTGPAAVIGKILTILNGDGDKGVLLRGEFPLIKEMCVIMLHCYDAEGKQNEWLYTQLQQAYRTDADVQFFNTGNDNAVESLKFYKIEDSNLILGLDNGQSDWI